MNLTRAQLKRQFDRAKKLGWIKHFEDAAANITRGYYDTADLIAIGSRETNLDPKWLTKPGDHGNGFGLMQADKRSFPEFTKTEAWKDARQGILFGAKVLMQKQRDYEANIGKRTSFKGSNGKTYSYTGKPASGQTAQHIVISSYNCGRWSQYAWANGRKIDQYSTGHDYGTDVMERAAVIRSFLGSAADSNGGATSSVNSNKQGEPANTASNPQEPPPTPPEEGGQTIISVPPVQTEVDSSLIGKIKTWYAALPAFVLSIFGGFWSWLQGAATEIIVAFLASAGLVVIVFVYLNYRARENEKDRIEKQKERDFELTKLQLQSAMDPQKQTVRLVPPPVEIPDTTTPEGA